MYYKEYVAETIGIFNHPWNCEINKTRRILKFRNKNRNRTWLLVSKAFNNQIIENPNEYSFEKLIAVSYKMVQDIPDSSGFVDEQSASFPGREEDRKTLFCLTSSLALFAARAA